VVWQRADRMSREAADAGPTLTVERVGQTGRRGQRRPGRRLARYGADGLRTRRPSHRPGRLHRSGSMSLARKRTAGAFRGFLSISTA
jgi:hypothetical protein